MHVQQNETIIISEFSNDEDNPIVPVMSKDPVICEIMANFICGKVILI